MNGIWDNVFASSIVMLAMILIMAAVLAAVSFRGTAKRRKHFEDLHKRLKSGQKVMTSSGIYGTIKKVSEDTVDMEVKSGAVMTVSRFMIAEIVSE
ncbi:MAG: preprotein translocase subunit YajC [Clostridiales bacterium]|jgi:preprotein translocase subunit YajC|nr:preprotein translocase subunit YajC [Clostridiales bacterium]